MTVSASYLICATPRSGSFLLCEAMRNTGVAGSPDEYFYADEESRWAAEWGLRAYTYVEYVRAALAYAGVRLGGTASRPDSGWTTA